MASAAYYEWLKAGSQFILATPCRDLQRLLQSAGFTVYAYPDDAHLKADPPQDHTPFSATGWPLPSPQWYGHAIDIMPRDSVMPLPQLARNIIAAKDNDVIGARWIKYLNWTDESGDCFHVSWQPDKRVTSSTDRGHIHVSARSDMTGSTVVTASGWNPLTGGKMALTQADVDLILKSDSVPWVDGKQYSVGGALNDTAQRAIAIRDAVTEIRADVDALIARPTQVVTGDQLVTAFMNALLADPSAVDALATTVASRVGMIPTATEIARAVGELTWHGKGE